ncbi:MAG: hypothetical protein DMG57_15495 [Acidobacteria bacterium]|nr:MAG: hypothetical protein DMG57_15495 [Acidobacteriota bacterium]
MKAKHRYFVLVAAAAALVNNNRPVEGFATTLGTASVTGVVRLEGTPPKPTPVNMAKEPSCAKMHATAPMTEDIVANANGTLQNVVVYVSEGLPDMPPNTAAETATFNQKDCTYLPHVLAVQANQKITVINSDKTSHNIHPLPAYNREWNKSQPPGVPAFQETFSREEIAIPVKCNVHPWMKAYIAVFRHPYFSVSNQDGSFSVKNLPPGNYTISAWQEKLGTVTQKVTVAAGEAKTLDFAFKIRAGR